MNKLYAKMKSFTLKIMGLFGYKPNHPTTLDEMLYEEAFEENDTINGNDYLSLPKQRVKRGEKNVIKNAILSDLDKYFLLLKKMKKADNNSYEFYKKIGGQIVTNFNFDASELNVLPSRWKKDRPAFGCILCTHDMENKVKNGDEKSHVPQMLYFTRYQKPPYGVQMVPDEFDIYKVTIHWYERNKFNVVTDMCIGIDTSNNVHLLLMKVDDSVAFYSKRQGSRGKEKQIVPRQKWGIHEFYKDWANEHKMTPEDLLVNLFCYTINMYDYSNMSGMIEVRAYKNNLVGRFMLQPQDAAHIFKDRERIGNTRKHIFHSVVPHTRTIKGKEKNIKLHFRGQRDFYWNGYNINIVVPIRETVLYLPEVDIRALDGDDPENKHLLKDSIDGGGELADLLLKIDRREYNQAQAL